MPYNYGADLSIVHDIVRELVEEKRASKSCSSPGDDAGKMTLLAAVK